MTALFNNQTTWPLGNTIRGERQLKTSHSASKMTLLLHNLDSMIKRTTRQKIKMEDGDQRDDQSEEHTSGC
jgi:hypothetical protein